MAIEVVRHPTLPHSDAWREPLRTPFCPALPGDAGNLFHMAHVHCNLSISRTTQTG